MKWLIKLFKIGFWMALIGCTVGAIAAISLYFYLEPDLPSTENLKNVRLQVPLRVYSADGKLMAEFGEKRRIPLTYSEIPQPMTDAFLAAEDDRFFEHPGVDYQGLIRAAVQLALTGERRQGGSTITMQVARNFYLSSEKTYTRKLNEILLALQIERELTKHEILELYLNKIYLGHRAYGVGAAAQVYYGKRVDELNLAQTTMIAGLPKAPSRFNPVTNPDRALLRRNYVLGRMKELDLITPVAYQTALAEPVTARLHRSETEMEAPYVAEMVRSEMVDRYGNEAYTEGYNVTTTIDSRLQGSANRAIRQALQAYDRRHGYRGPARQLEIDDTSSDEALDLLLADHNPIADLRPAIVTATEGQQADAYLGEGIYITLPWKGLEWAREHIDENRLGAKLKQASDILQPGDLIYVLPEIKEGEEWWRLAQVPAAAGALVSVDPDSGAIQALIGGYDFYQSKFNRVTQAKRQPGSGFKAIIYSAALEAGFTPASLINDAPVVFNDPSLEGAWRPENYSGKFFGPTRLRYALTKSRNLVSIRLLRNMGVKFALAHAERFGFNTGELPNNLSLALGSGAVTPLQMARAYSVLANGGFRIEPYFIERIEDIGHNEIFKATPLTVCEACDQPPQEAEAADQPATEEQPAIAPRVISPENHYLMNSMMRDVITSGTARKARALGRKDLAGKTGTTNEQRDAWFNGFNRSLVAIAWVGFDSSQPLGRGEVGGRAALPAWIAFMRDALENTDEIPLEMPPGMVTVRIDPKTGKRADINQEDGIFEVFRAENAPKETATQPITNNGPTAGDTGTEPGGDSAELF
ncbi:MAG: penicillin-binding protein 1A [Sedimenticola sp.]